MLYGVQLREGISEFIYYLRNCEMLLHDMLRPRYDDMIFIVYYEYNRILSLIVLFYMSLDDIVLS